MSARLVVDTGGLAAVVPHPGGPGEACGRVGGASAVPQGAVASGLRGAS